jgi:hypothetical protein
MKLKEPLRAVPADLPQKAAKPLAVLNMTR